MPRARRMHLASTVATVTAPCRAAVYTRKSTDEGLDRAFTTLDNQRERAEAYAASQGWATLADRYDDGGFSGGTTERPALKRLLADAEAGRLETLIVYKLDRLSRSLIDFLKIHQFLEKHGVALVSVTESINTSTPHGRMMVNVLLSFAQYERELIGERTADKIRGARRQGRWTGGMPPLGLDVAPEGGRLVFNRDEAEQVRAIFQLYVETPSLVKVAAELNRRGWRRKSWITKGGAVREGKRWDRVTLQRVLTDPLYIGMQKLGGQTFTGEHEAIVPKRLFDQVQALMNKNRSDGGASARNKYSALLRGLLRCTACDRAMTHTPTRSGSRMYRYYTCQRAQKEGHAACPTKSVPAQRVEEYVVDQVRRIAADPELQQATFQQAVAQVKAQRLGLKAERIRLNKMLASAREQTASLVGAVTRNVGPAAEAIQIELARAQERATALEARDREIHDELAALDAQAIDPADVARALAEYDPIWDVLLTPERERVLHLLIERVDLDGRTGEVEITWRLAGFGELAAEVAP